MGVGGQGFSSDDNMNSQVPTCLVITSNESSSSIDTQFTAMCDELSGKEMNSSKSAVKPSALKSINLVLDEKKCGNIK